ncbi:hypothetical protein HDU76_013151 [Blyttiomyces sp. JEL0837]|nr:hypothetical protein HDU76_013151 [Blyttiomyces sp. JEL0837]
MRGLTVFIADLRNCRARELEEKRVNKEMANIRSKFKDLSLNGYQKKKYVAKLIYMYILGWEVDFGHMEAVNLLSSTKYSEKQIGYLAVTLLLSESSDLSRMVVNAIGKDLASPQEINVCLALHAIANIGSKEMAESLAYQVEQLLVAGYHGSFVRKKAALCLLRLYRKHPDFFQAVDWAPKILNMMDDSDLGTALAVATLVLALAQQYPDAYFGCIQKSITRLHKIHVDRDYTADYVYYKVPVPWLQVKLLRLLQYYPPPAETHQLQRLANVLQIIIRNAQDVPKNVQHNNAQNAILFEAINLCIHLDPESELVDQTLGLLGNFIASKETNVRYLGLETMCHLAGTGARNCLDALRVNQEVIVSSLRDKDISVRRRALDLLYSMCDQTNAREIVAELLQYLQLADYAIREELVLKIAILTEKYAMEYSWYVDVILQLITIAGDHVLDEIWYRVVQIVTNNEDLQLYAVTTLLNALKSPTCHETTLKVGGYLLGEFGHLIANNPGCSPIDQFTALHSKFGACTPKTRSLLLTTYIKFVNLFPEIKEEIVTVFKQHRHVLDVEIQQRASEYLAIASMETDDILQTVCEEMPLFPDRESALVARLNKKIGDTEDKRTWVIGGKDANVEITKMQMKTFDAIADAVASGTSSSNTSPAKREPVAERRAEAHAAKASAKAAAAAKVSGSSAKDLLSGGKSTASLVSSTLDDETLYNRLLILANGLLHRDATLEIGLKSEYRDNLGRFALFFGNRSLQPISSFNAEIIAEPNVKVTLVQPIPAVIPQGSQFNQVYKIECIGPCDPLTTLKVTYVIGSAGQLASLDLRLPIVLTKFVVPVELSSADFFQRWKQIGGPPRESQAVFSAGGNGVLDIAEVKRRVSGLGLGILEGVDPSPSSVIATGIFSCADLGKVGCMVRLEVNNEHQMYRATVRTTNDVASQIIRNQIEALIPSKSPKIHHQEIKNNNMPITIRQITHDEAELIARGDAICRNAFNTFTGHPNLFGDGDIYFNRIACDYSTVLAYGAFDNNELVGSALLTRWGSFGFIGPVSVDPSKQNQGVAQLLLKQCDVALREIWKVKKGALFTFAQSAKHVNLYQKIGLHATSLTAVLSKPVKSVDVHPKFTLLSSLSGDALSKAYAQITEVTNSNYAGFDFTAELKEILRLKIGDALLIYDEETPETLNSVAMIFSGAKTEAGSDSLFVKVSASRVTGTDSINIQRGVDRFVDLLNCLEAYAGQLGVKTLRAGVNLERVHAYRAMQKFGFRTEIQGVMMQWVEESESTSNAHCFIMDDLR